MIHGYLQKSKQYRLPEGSDFLDNFKKINIFVGSNNAGKSRFLRNIFSGNKESFLYYNQDHNSHLIEVYNQLPESYKDLYIANDLKSLISSNTGDYGTRFNDFMVRLYGIKGRGSGIGNVWDFDVANSIRGLINSVGGIPQEIAIKNTDHEFIYVPMLRGMRHLDISTVDIDKKQDLYTRRTQSDYGIPSKGDDPGNKEIFSGVSIYRDVRKMLLGSKEDRNFIKRFEDFLSENFFQKSSVTIIPDHDTDSIKINLNSDEDRKIYEVGDGIQSIIINTFPIFKNQDKDLILCIEEPEMTMHPSIQRILINTFIKFPKLQVFLTTHSNHFLDLSYDYPDEISIFSFEKIHESEFEIKNITDNSKIIDLLGVRNSSVFLANCIIWTEGVTDRMLIRKLLELVNFKFKEDYHYAFGEYGGNNLENFDYSDFKQQNITTVRTQSISKRNFVIIDNDGIQEPSNTKFIRRKNIKIYLGGDRVFDEHIEIENLVPAEVWVKVVKKIIELKPGKEIVLKKDYRDNITEFNLALGTKKIGTILREYLIESPSTASPKYFNDSGIKCLGEDKKYIMSLVIEELEGFNVEDLPDEAKNMISSIQNFVEAANQPL